jgi:hypothetical protein
VFDDDAYREIYFCSTGIPRRINNICDLALLVGYGNGLSIIDRKSINSISEDLESASGDNLMRSPQVQKMQDTTQQQDSGASGFV